MQVYADSLFRGRLRLKSISNRVQNPRSDARFSADDLFVCRNGRIVRQKERSFPSGNELALGAEVTDWKSLRISFDRDDDRIFADHETIVDNIQERVLQTGLYCDVFLSRVSNIFVLTCR